MACKICLGTGLETSTKKEAEFIRKEIIDAQWTGIGLECDHRGGRKMYSHSPCKNCDGKKNIHEWWDKLVDEHIEKLKEDEKI